MDSFLDKIRAFELTNKEKKETDEALHALDQFVKRYPYRKLPEEIENLTSEKLYRVGSDDYFFLWIEHKTRRLGAIFTYGGKTYPNAVEKLPLFKSLLKIIVDDKKDIQAKIDADWDQIRGFGGDRLIAKKILFCYYPEAVLPIFKTDHLELFARKLDIDYESQSIEQTGKTYANLTVGEKYQLLNALLIAFQSAHLGNLDHIIFSYALYHNADTQKAGTAVSREASKPLSRLGLLFTPRYEQEVLYLFCVFHKDIGFPYIQTIHEAFPDVTAIDNDRNSVRIELEVFASDFLAHKHDAKACEYIVCWENDLVDMPQPFPEVLSLKDFTNDFLDVR
jgi:hypothetical protein